MTTCKKCRSANARRGSDLCGACAIQAEHADRRERPSYYHALAAARRIDEHDIRVGRRIWADWACRPRMQARTDHYDCYRRCIGTLDGRMWLSGVVVAVEAGDEAGVWVYLPAVPNGLELHQPFIKLDRKRVEFVSEGS